MKKRAIRLPAPYLRRVWLDGSLVADAGAYPFCLPLLRRGFESHGAPPDFLSHSHGEGFLRFFEERCHRQGIFIFDEPESALSPSRQIAFLKLLRRMESSGICQVVMASHSPLLMAYPKAQLLRLSSSGLEPISVQETDHYRLMREFCADPAGFIDEVLAS
jgi:predicted ATPase